MRKRLDYNAPDEIYNITVAVDVSCYCNRVVPAHTLTDLKGDIVPDKLKDLAEQILEEDVPEPDWNTGFDKRIVIVASEQTREVIIEDMRIGPSPFNLLSAIGKVASDHMIMSIEQVQREIRRALVLYAGIDPFTVEHLIEKLSGRGAHDRQK